MRAVQRAELGDTGAMGSSFTRIGGRPARRLGLAACVSVFLSGCALPPMLEVASLAVGGGSWLFTGKSTADHAISVAVGEDCAMHRPVFGEELCTPYEVMRRLDDPSDDVMIGDVRLKGLEEITEFVTVVSGLAGPSDDAPTIAFDPAPVLDDSSAIALEPAPVDRVANSVANGAGDSADDARDFSAVDLDAMAQAFDEIQTAAGRAAAAAPRIGSYARPLVQQARLVLPHTAGGAHEPLLY